MRVVIAGSSGLLGTALVAALRRDGQDIARLVRRRPVGPDEYEWDPEKAVIDGEALDGADAVVNLCGAGVADQRWTGAYKQQLRDSRIAATDVLAGEAAGAGVKTLINASGIHVYGDTGDRVVDESAPPGTGFLPSLCTDWEAATEAARSAGVRTVLLRTATVLARSGGPLERLRRVYALGLGARLGNGRQYFPWISLDDAIGAIRFALAGPDVSGPLNLAGPTPVTYAQFHRAMAQATHRPSRIVVPGILVRAALGEFADEGLLGGPRAIPAALESAGYTFRHNTIGEALDSALR